MRFLWDPDNVPRKSLQKITNQQFKKKSQLRHRTRPVKGHETTDRLSYAWLFSIDFTFDAGETML